MVLVLLVFGSLAFLSHAAPLAKRMVDMTYSFKNSTLHFPTAREFQLNILIYNQRVPWVQSDKYSSSTHVGTHMDAPAHFVKGAKTIEQLDIAHFMAPAAVVDISAKGELDPDAEASVEDFLGWETTTGQSLNDTILLLRTGWGRKWGDRDAYFGTTENDPTKLHFPGISAVAAQWLVDHRKILGFGVDTLSLDKGTALDYPAHKILLGYGIFGLENAARMEDIPIYGAKLYVQPMKIEGASGAPTRIIATYPEVIFDRQMSKK